MNCFASLKCNFTIKISSLRIIAGTLYILENNKQLLDNLKKICLCRSIKVGTVMAAIRGGTMTFEALRRELGVGTGNCKAKRCRTKIEDRIQCHKDSLKEAPVEPEAPSGQTL